jgi:transposase-like protein
MSLAERGIHGLEMITSDDHKGLAAARKAVATQEVVCKFVHFA